tara:strand:- start:32 stop:220 length:189 start_codon:yes stop_codon:yes gene_type:complete
VTNKFELFYHNTDSFIILQINVISMKGQLTKESKKKKQQLNYLWANHIVESTSDPNTPLIEG